MNAGPAELMAHASGKVKDCALRLQDAVGARTHGGDLLRARVQGSELAPYRVTVDLGRGVWRCSCPDEYNAMCKHVYATLLTYQASPGTFAPAPAARRLPNVEGWADADVETLLERLLEQHPATVRDWAREVHENGWDEEEKDW